jgi:hypothetical protein
MADAVVGLVEPALALSAVHRPQALMVVSNTLKPFFILCLLCTLFSAAVLKQVLRRL